MDYDKKGRAEVVRKGSVSLLMKNDQGIAKIIEVSLLDQRFILIRFLDDMKDRELLGIVTKIDQQNRRIQVSHTEGMDWIDLDDILQIKVQAE